MNNHNQGFIALTSVIVISMLLMGMVLALSSTGYLGRSSILNDEFKTQSREAAESCMDVIRIRLARDISYTGTSTLRVVSNAGTQVCLYEVDNIFQNKLIIAQIPATSTPQTNSKNFYTNLRVTVDGGDLKILDIQEFKTCNISPITGLFACS